MLSNLRVKRLPALATTLVAVGFAAGALAYLTSAGTGTAAAGIATLTMPGSPAASATGATVSVSWTASSINGSVAATTYTVERYNGSGTDLGAAACSPVASSSGSPNAFGSFACTDTPGSAGTYKYLITARYLNDWTATSAFTNTVTAGADGFGTLTTPTTSVSASSTGKTVAFTYTAATGGVSNGEVDIAVPTGWTAPISTNAAGCTTASAGTLSFSGQTIKVSGLTLAAGATLTVTYGATSGASCTAADGAVATSSTGAQTWQGQEKATSGGTLTTLASSPSITVYAADGSGTLTTPTTSVVVSSTGYTITFTYTAATGGLNNGTVTLAVPTGWSAPSTTGSAAGYTTSSTGTVSVSSQTITVSGITLSGGSTSTIVYGSKASSGPGATAPSSTGAQTWQGQEQSTSGGTLTNLTASPSILVTTDGAGTLTTTTTSVSAGSTGKTITFTYTAPTGGIASGEVDVAVPTGWTAPTASNAVGCTTKSAGTLSFSGQTIKVSAVTLAAGATLTVTYGATSAGCTANDGATATSSTGAQTWQGQEKTTSGGTLTNLASSPSITVYAADGSGTLTTPTTTVSAGSTGNTIVFTYTAATGGISNGEVDIAVPTGWTAPISTNAAGCTTASAGTLSFSSQTIKVSALTLAGGSTLTITYGATSGGSCTAGDGAIAGSSTGAQTWQGQEKSLSGDTLTNLASSPSITAYAGDGSGTLTTPTTTVVNGSSGNTITFTYTAATGGISGGAVDIAVPTGWTAPVSTNASGCTTASTGTLSFSGQTIKVSALTLAAGSTLTVTYGTTSGGSCTAGDGATATTTGGSATWQAREQSTSGGPLTNLASSPSINVYAPDGSGTLTATTASVSAGSTGKTIVFTYTAAAGGITSGEVDIAVPTGWTAPTAANATGCTTKSLGTLSFSGQTIKVTGLTLTAGSTLTVTYGATSGSPCTANDWATATSTTGAQTWQGQEKSTSGGTLTNLTTSPSITVYAADGSGTLTTPTTSVVHSSTGNTITFTYTAATGGISGGEVDITVPSGWTAPKTTSVAGCTTASSGTAAAAGQAIKVTSLTLSGGSTLTVVYGATSGATTTGSCAAGDGATATNSTGSQTWQGQEKSLSGDTLATIAPSPIINVT